MTTKPTELGPADFAFSKLGIKPYIWQIQCLEALGRQPYGGKPLSVRAANGSGKTSNLVAPAVLWFLSKYPKGQVVITSGSFRQIEKQLWPAMRVFAPLFPHWTFLQTEIKTPEGGWALGFSTDDPGRAEGWHPKAGKEIDPVFIIVDEAKSVPRGIYEAFDRCTRMCQLWVSSPGAPAGEFYESFNDNSKYYWNKRITSEDCPHIDPEKRARDAEKYGVDSPLFRSMHLAEFCEDVEKLILSKEALEAGLILAQESYGESGTGGKTAFFDFAAGGDENVFALRVGSVVRIVDAWRERDTVQAVRRFIRLAKAEGLQPHECYGDGDGLGLPMLNQFKEEGYYINEFRGGQAAADPDHYSNRISEAWITSCRAIERGEWSMPDLDPMSKKQLTTRFLEWDAQGRLRVESKDKMAGRGVKSPDRADAILGAIYHSINRTGAITPEDVSRITVDNTNSFAVPIVQF